jgi:hypothetical protein
LINIYLGYRKACTGVYDQYNAFCKEFDVETMTPNLSSSLPQIFEDIEANGMKSESINAILDYLVQDANPLILKPQFLTEVHGIG